VVVVGSCIWSLGVSYKLVELIFIKGSFSDAEVGEYYSCIAIR